MKKVSKLVSVILTMAMLCSAVVFTQMTTVSAADGDVLLNENFNSLTEAPTLAGETATAALEGTDDKYVTVGKSTWNGSGWVFNQQTDGTFTVEFDFNVPTTNKKVYFGLFPSSVGNSAAHGLILLTANSNGHLYAGTQEGKLYTADTSSTSHVSDYTANTWYTFKAYVNTATRKYIAKLYTKSNGSLKATLDVTLPTKYAEDAFNNFADYCGIPADTQYGMFGLLGTDNTATAIDNIKIKDTPAVDTDYIFYSDYDVFEAKNEIANSTSLVSENGNKVLNIDTERSAVWHPIKHTLSTSDIKEKTIQVKFDFKFEKLDGPGYIMFTDNSGASSANRVTMLAIQNDGGLLFAQQDNGTKYIISETSEMNVWYSYDAIINMNTKECTVKVTKRDDGTTHGTVVSETIEAVSGSYAGFPDNAAFRLMYCPGLSKGTKLDNISVAEYFAPPAAPTSSNVVLRDVAGTVQSDAAAVSPLTKTVEIDFGVEMNTTTISNSTVFVSAKGGTTALEGSNVSASGTKATITLPTLAIETPYTLNVKGDVKSVKNKILGEDKTYDFTTSKGEASFTITNTNPGTYASFKGTEITIPCSYVNSTLAPKSVQFIIAYYDANNMLVKAELADASFTAEQTSGTYEFKHTILDVTGATNAKVMAWENFSTLRPLSVYATLN